jgi:hypothetical protein
MFFEGCAITVRRVGSDETEGFSGAEHSRRGFPHRRWNPGGTTISKGQLDTPHAWSAADFDRLQAPDQVDISGLKLPGLALRREQSELEKMPVAWQKRNVKIRLQGIPGEIRG